MAKLVGSNSSKNKSGDKLLKVAAILATVLFFSTASLVATEQPRNELDQIRAALIRSLCLEVYWYKEDLRQRIPLRLKVRIEGKEPIPLPYEQYEMKTDGKKFFAWIDDAMLVQGDRVAYFLIGRVKGNSAAVILREAHNVDLTPPIPPDFEKAKHFFETGDVIRDNLTIPSDCTPRYDPPTSKKKQMVQAIVNHMEEQLSLLAKHRIASYPKEITIIIADFNVDYPNTFVLIEQPKELWAVTLHDPQNYDSDEHEQRGGYPSQSIRIKPGHKNLLEKIRKHGIKRKIVLTP